jgi:uncharacterized surface protein with fasciclin (FAS1) repeats
MKNIYETIAGLYFLKNVKAIVEKAEMTKMLKDEGPFTLFAPQDGVFNISGSYNADDPAFHTTEIGDLELILADRESARQMIKYHLISGIQTVDTLRTYSALTSLLGKDIPVIAYNGQVAVGGAEIMIPDITCTNGIIQVISLVMSPTLD